MGGGVKGIAHIGALKFLFEHNVLTNLKATAGTSAGSLVALMIAFGNNTTITKYEKIERTMMSLNFSKLKQESCCFLKRAYDLFSKFGVSKKSNLELMVKILFN